MPAPSPASWSIGELVAAVRDGESEAWNEVVRRYAGLVAAVARRHRLQECDVADAVQNTWMRAVERFDTLREPDRLGAWLAAVTARESLALIRRAQREPVAGEELPDAPAPGPGPEATAVLADARRAVARSLDTLDERWRRLAGELFIDPDRGYRQVAQAMGMPVGSIGPTRGRLLRELRLRLEEAGYCEGVV